MKNFSSEKEFQKFLNEKCLIQKGEGSEGLFYLSRKDKLGYKILFDNVGYEIEDYNPNNIILDEEVNIDSFVFPIELLMVNNKMRGYVTRYQKHNLLADDSFLEIDIFNFDFHALKQAYKQMKVDVALLSSKGIRIFDLANNLVYDGEKLYAIDTCSYSKSNNPQLLKENVESLDYALDVLLEILLSNCDIEVTESIKKDRKDLGFSMSEYISYIIRKVNSCKKSYIKNFNKEEL